MILATALHFISCYHLYLPHLFQPQQSLPYSLNHTTSMSFHYFLLSAHKFSLPRYSHGFSLHSVSTQMAAHLENLLDYPVCNRHPIHILPLPQSLLFIFFYLRLFLLQAITTMTFYNIIFLSLKVSSMRTRILLCSSPAPAGLPVVLNVLHCRVMTLPMPEQSSNDLKAWVNNNIKQSL